MYRVYEKTLQPCTATQLMTGSRWGGIHNSNHPTKPMIPPRAVLVFMLTFSCVNKPFILNMAILIYSLINITPICTNCKFKSFYLLTMKLALNIALNFINSLSHQRSAVVEVIQLNCISVEAILKRIMRNKKR